MLEFLARFLILSTCLFSSAAAAGRQNFDPVGQDRPTREASPRRVVTKELKVIGIEIRTTNKEEADPTTGRIPGLWQRVFQENLIEKIPNRKAGGSLMGIYAKYESDFTGAYSLIVGVEVSSLKTIPPGMTGLKIPAWQYLAFSARGPMPKSLIDTWGTIWKYFSENSSPKRAYTVDYEIHNGNDKADVYIAIK